jgi:hypothetical protein
LKQAFAQSNVAFTVDLLTFGAELMPQLPASEVSLLREQFAKAVQHHIAANITMR